MNITAGLVFALLTSLSLALAAQAQEAPLAPDGDKDSTQISTDEVKNPLTLLGNEYQNSIRLLRNRFRIDYAVDDVTLVFFREYGSAPVVLVRPDGSKIYIHEADGRNVSWFESATFDMIYLKNPMPGPWQAVGQIKSGSRVLVLSNLQLHAEPLPPLIFSGEIIKQTATLSNAGNIIEDTQFRDVVKLKIDFQSTNKPEENNFGAGTRSVAVFEDNGLGMDERPMDGEFTGQFNLALPHGEWRPIFYVATPMFSREQVGEPLMLRPTPIEVSVEPDLSGEGAHRLLVKVDTRYVKPESLLLDGVVRFPNTDEQGFNLSDLEGDTWAHNIVSFEYGIYRIKLTAFGKTINGRDFILDIPEYSFVAERPEVPAIAVEAIEDEVLDPAVAPVEAGIAPLPLESEEEGLTAGMLWLIIGANLGLLILGGGFIWWMLRDKPLDEAEEQNADEAESVPPETQEQDIVDLPLPDEKTP